MIESILNDLKGRYFAKLHPACKNTIIIYNIDLLELRKLSKKYRCSGMYLESHSMITNFYKY